MFGHIGHIVSAHFYGQPLKYWDWSLIISFHDFHIGFYHSLFTIYRHLLTMSHESFTGIEGGAFDPKPFSSSDPGFPRWGLRFAIVKVLCRIWFGQVQLSWVGTLSRHAPVCGSMEGSPA